MGKQPIWETNYTKKKGKQSFAFAVVLKKGQ